jgi:hypothetical protein
VIQNLASMVSSGAELIGPYQEQACSIDAGTLVSACWGYLRRRRTLGPRRCCRTAR